MPNVRSSASLATACSLKTEHNSSVEGALSYESNTIGKYVLFRYLSEFRLGVLSFWVQKNQSRITEAHRALFIGLSRESGELYT